jgi:hypothetical protein
LLLLEVLCPEKENCDCAKAAMARRAAAFSGKVLLFLLLFRKNECFDSRIPQAYAASDIRSIQEGQTADERALLAISSWQWGLNARGWSSRR